MKQSYSVLLKSIPEKKDQEHNAEDKDSKTTDESVEDLQKKLKEVTLNKEGEAQSLSCKNQSKPNDGGLVYVNRAMAIVIFDLSALSEIATYKSSVVGAWKVDPPTFQLLTNDLNAMDKVLALHFPAVQFAILSCLFTHSQRCNHFIPSSKSKTGSQSKESVSIISMLSNILSEAHTIADIK